MDTPSTDKDTELLEEIIYTYSRKKYHPKGITKGIFFELVTKAGLTSSYLRKDSVYFKNRYPPCFYQVYSPFTDEQENCVHTTYVTKNKKHIKNCFRIQARKTKKVLDSQYNLTLDLTTLVQDFAFDVPNITFELKFNIDQFYASIEMHRILEYNKQYSSFEEDCIYYFTKCRISK